MMAKDDGRYNLVEMNSIKDVRKEHILDTSPDGKVIVTTDGVKVSDDLIKQAKTEARARSAAAGATAGGGLNEADVRRIVRSELESAVPSVANLRGIVMEEIQSANALSEANIREIAADEAQKAISVTSLPGKKAGQ
jgi:hypothetical protein